MKRIFSVSSIVMFIESVRASDRLLLRLALFGVVAAAIWFIVSLNNTATVTEVRTGGTLKEGIVGTPRFVNPVLALTRADQDVTALVYSGLFAVDSAGDLVPNIASAWELSPDGTTYTITLRQDVQFHDDIPLTATDVMFTIGLVQNDDLKSPLRGNWSGVNTNVIDDYTFEIVLEEPFAPFIENLTLGILPAHIWREIPIEQVPFSSFNTTPVGSGPFEIADTTFGNNGTVSEYRLVGHTTHQPAPFLTELFLRFYADEAALVEAWGSEVTSSAYLPPTVVANQLDPDDFSVSEIPLTRTFALFFNQNRSAVLRDPAVREALELTLDRDQLVQTGLNGAGIPSATAVHTSADGIELVDLHASLGTTTDEKEDGLAIATMVLQEAGWNQTDGGTWEKTIDGDLTELGFTIRTVNSPLFEATARELVIAFERLGVVVSTEQFTQSDLVQSVIRERDFEMLLFGIDPGRTQDLYPFWHSSQQNDPGLNIAQYTNLTVDGELEIARTTSDQATRQAALATIDTIITEERPAIFLFRPTVQYVAPVTLESTFDNRLSQPADRFSSITSWYTEERNLWPFFTNQANEPDQTLDTVEQNNN